MGKLYIRRPWPMAILLVTLSMLLLWACAGAHYFEVDDTPTVKSFIGFEGGIPAHFHLYYHTLLAWSLFGLSLAIPGVAWVSVIQLVCLWLSNVVLVKCLLKWNERTKHSLLRGTVASCLYLGTFTLYFCALPTYTTTAALLGAAAVAQVMGVEADRETSSQVFWRVMGSIGLLYGCYLWRQIGVMPSLAFWLLGLACRAERGRSLKLFWQGCAVCAVGFLLLGGIREIELRTTNAGDFLKWHQARIELFDYTDFTTNPQTAATDAAWSPEQTQLVSHWYFMDENITTKAFLAQAAVQTPSKVQQGLWRDLLESMRNVKQYIKSSWEWMAVLVVIVLLAVFSFANLCTQSKTRLWGWSWAPCGLFCAGMLLVYLGWNGRINLRALICVLLPMSAFFLMLYLSAEKASSHGARGIIIKNVTIGVMAGVCILCSVFHYKDIIQPRNIRFFSIQEERAKKLEDFARANPDYLIVYSPFSLRDARLFPDISKGIPTNLISWGDWGARTPSWMYQLSVYGIDGERFTAEVFFQDNILVLGNEKGPPQELTDHIAQWTGKEIIADFYGAEGELLFYQYLVVEDE